LTGSSEDSRSRKISVFFSKTLKGGKGKKKGTMPGTQGAAKKVQQEEFIGKRSGPEGEKAAS